MAITKDRKQRLRTLENNIRKCADSIQTNGLEVGRDLIKIRDEELWRESPDQSWNEYLKKTAGELVGKSPSRAAILIQAAEIAKRLPESRSTGNSRLTLKQLKEVGRLAPDKPKVTGGRGKDYSKLKKQDVARVLKNAEKLSGSEKPSARHIRRAVDTDLGVDRAAKAKATKAKRDRGIDLHDYIQRTIGTIEGATELFSDVPADGWTLLAESHPNLAERLAAACDELAGLLRS